MPDCPKCRQAVKSDAIACPYCRTSLKAYGHPGIPLYQVTGDQLLCNTCVYHVDDSCNYPQRPHARECTMYQSVESANSQLAVKEKAVAKLKTTLRYQPAMFPRLAWWRQNPSWVWLIGLFLVIFLVKLAGS